MGGFRNNLSEYKCKVIQGRSKTSLPTAPNIGKVPGVHGHPRLCTSVLPKMLAARLIGRRFPIKHCRASFATAASATRLNSVSPQDLAHFATILPPSSVLSTLSPVSSPPHELDHFNTDWMGRFRGSSTTVLKPKTTQQVSEILRWCNERRIGVVPQGGNTGLVGGSVPVRDELILSLSNMNKVRDFDPVSGQYHSFSHTMNSVHEFSVAGILVADAGCILQSLTDYVAPHNHIMPIDLGAKGRYVESTQVICSRDHHCQRTVAAK